MQIDTARTYTGGTSEEYLGKIDWRKRGLKIETKLYPNVVSRSAISTTSLFVISRYTVQQEAPKSG